MGKSLIRENQEKWPAVTFILCPWQQKGLLTRAAEGKVWVQLADDLEAEEGAGRGEGRKGAGGGVGDVSAW